VPDRIVFCPRFLHWMQPESQIDVLYQTREDIRQLARRPGLDLPGRNADLPTSTHYSVWKPCVFFPFFSFSDRCFADKSFDSLQHSVVDQSVKNGQIAWTLPNCMQLKQELPHLAPNNPYSLVLFMISKHVIWESSSDTSS
jgi:hypothetical protein